jgi:hypothetical protein
LHLFFKFATASCLVGVVVACNEKPQQDAAVSPAIAPVQQPVVAVPVIDAPSFIKGGVSTIRGACSVDAVAGIAHQQDQQVSAAASTKFEGWAGDLGAGTVPAAAALELVGSATYFAAIEKRVERPDVAAAHKAGMLRAGWELDLKSEALPAGRYGMNIVQSDGTTTTRCDTGRSIVIVK